MEILYNKLQTTCGALIEASTIEVNELSIRISKNNLLVVCELLKNNLEFNFAQLIDLCGVDYLHYGKDEWETNNATATGFSRGVAEQNNQLNLAEAQEAQNNRFAIVYHLLSLVNNFRLRIKVFIHGNDEPLIVPSVVSIWNNANWYEREVFDLFGVSFDQHPDLRRILTDYDFVGNPLRKDFPLIGNVEVKYDVHEKRVIYQPVSIEARTLVPKVIREDARYAVTDKPQGE